MASPDKLQSRHWFGKTCAGVLLGFGLSWPCPASLPGSGPAALMAAVAKPSSTCGWLRCCGHPSCHSFSFSVAAHAPGCGWALPTLWPLARSGWREAIWAETSHENPQRHHQGLQGRAHLGRHPAGLMLFVAFYAGSITMFEKPLERWATPPSTLSAPVPMARAPDLLVAVLKAHPRRRRTA